VARCLWVGHWRCSADNGGFTSGEVVVRAIGNDLHLDYPVIDQTRRLAARTDHQRCVRVWCPSHAWRRLELLELNVGEQFLQK
jgi:hypothetical protein